MRRSRSFFILAVAVVSVVIAVAVGRNNTAKAEVAVGPVDSLGNAIHCTTIYAASLPYTISSSGVYCLAGSMNYTGSGAAITIQVNATWGPPWGAVLDFGGFNLNGNNTTGQIGVLAADNGNYVIRNGTITNFLTGIKTNSATANVIISEMRIVGSTDAIRVDGSGPVEIRKNFLQNASQLINVTNYTSQISIHDNLLLDQTLVTTAAITFDANFSGTAFIERNEVAHVSGDGIKISAGSAFLRYNIVKDVGGNAYTGVGMNNVREND